MMTEMCNPLYRTHISYAENTGQTLLLSDHQVQSLIPRVTYSYVMVMFPNQVGAIPYTEFHI